MANALVEMLNETQRVARGARKAARSAVSIGVVTAVDPTSQTISVTPVGGHQPIDGVTPFQVESPIGVGTEATPTLVRLYKHGGAYFAAPIETDLNARIGKDTRAVYMDYPVRTVYYDEQFIVTLGVGFPAGLILFSEEASKMVTSTIRSVFGSLDVFLPRIPITATRLITSLVKTPIATQQALGIPGDGERSLLVSGDGVMLPSYCYDIAGTINQIQLGGVDRVTRVFTSTGASEYEWLIQPPSGTRGLLFGFYRLRQNNHPAMRLTLSTGAAAEVTWFPMTDHETVERQDGRRELPSARKRN